jgi:hypothetical protein
MKASVIRITLFILIFAAVGCAETEDENHEEVQSFSSYVRDVFEVSANQQAESVIEGEDFQFTDADELENYDDLLAKESQ